MKPARAFLIVWLHAIQLLTSRAANNEIVDITTLDSIHEVTPPLTLGQEDHAHRSLQQSDVPSVAPTFRGEFSLPFQVIWNMAFSDETIIREPTQDELTGLFHATLNWLMFSAREYYADQSNVMKLDRIEATHYGANFNASDVYPSTVGMECTCYFQANQDDDIPSVYQFLVAFSSGFNRTVFVNEYLANADPATNMYRNVTKLRYNILTSNLESSGIQIVTLPIDIKWQYEIGFGIPDRAPTNEEYRGLEAATNDWLVHLFMDAYPPNNNNDNPVFHMLDTTTYSRKFDTNHSPPHEVQMLTDVSFRLTPDPENDLPPTLSVTQQDLLDILKAANLNNFRDNYVHKAEPRLSLFSGVVKVDWSPADGN